MNPTTLEETLFIKFNRQFSTVTTIQNAFIGEQDAHSKILFYSSYIYFIISSTSLQQFVFQI